MAVNDSDGAVASASHGMAAMAEDRLRRSTAAVIGRWLIFAIWLGSVLWLASRHVIWRDEGRAWSIALQGSNLVDMLRQLRGEGHPPLWYVLLRVAHDLSGSRLALPATAMAVMAAAALVLLFASPFRLWLSSLILAGHAFVYEYAVMARNYGISALLMLVLAALYRRCRDRGVWLGVVCALLAITNAHSAFLVCAFFLLWLLDLASDGLIGWNRVTYLWAVNGGIATAGLIACAVSMFPTYNDAAVGFGLASNSSELVTALSLPAWTFHELVLQLPAAVVKLVPFPEFLLRFLLRVMSVTLFGALLGLIRWPAALIGGAVALLGMSMFFAVIYTGSYRHEALWLVFVVALYWMLQEREQARPGMAGRPRSAVGAFGFACFVLLLAAQVTRTAAELVSQRSNVPESQVRNLAEAMQARPDLRQAILLPDPDYLLEAFPYYGDNPIYLPREHRFGAISHFTAHAQLRQSLGDLMAAAQLLCRERQRPVVIVIGQDLDALTPPASVGEGYNLTFTVTAAEIATLKGSTEFLGRFTPAVSDEVFGAFALKPPCMLAGWSG